MGIDIEIYAEVFDGEKWKPAEPLVENEFYDPDDDPLEPKLSRRICTTFVTVPSLLSLPMLSPTSFRGSRTNRLPLVAAYLRMSRRKSWTSNVLDMIVSSGTVG